jgi:hypothetical protein
MGQGAPSNSASMHSFLTLAFSLFTDSISPHGDPIKYGSFEHSRNRPHHCGSSDGSSEASCEEYAGDVNPCSPLKILHEITVIPVADEHGHLAHYPGEEEDRHHRERCLDEEEKKGASQSVLGSGVEIFKCLYSMSLLIFSIVIVMAAIFSRQTVATDGMGVNPNVAFIVFWALIVWLAKMEGGQGCLVGLQPIPKVFYSDSHPRTLMCTSLAHKGDNMERFIVGRQFLVVLVVFVTNMMASSVKNVSVLGLSDALTDSFLTSGIAVTLIAIMIGQSAQINAANCMLDFINTYFMLFTTYLSLALDMSGLLHSVYLVQILFSKITNTPIESTEPPRSGIQNLFFWARIVFSCVALGFSFAVTLSALFNGQTTMYAGVPEVVSILVLFILLGFIGMMEGMQIALFAVVNLPAKEIEKHPMAFKSCELTFRGSNLQAFLIGRQMCVTLCMFIVARITSCDVDAGEETIFGVSDGIQNFFNTGLLGAVITCIVGSLAWRIVASSFPVAFLSNPLIYAILRLCLFVEASGICSAAWLLALLHKQVVGYQLDEVYIGTPEERAAEAKKKEEDDDMEKLI